MRMSKKEKMQYRMDTGCDFCHSMCSIEYSGHRFCSIQFRCHGLKMCPAMAGYVECQIKECTACVSKDLVRPIYCSLQDRIVALAQAFAESNK